MSASVIIFLSSVLVVGIIVFVIVILTRHAGVTTLNREKYQGEWLAIEHSINESERATVEMAIIKADKLVDQALRERGVSGQTMGERLKSARADFSNIDALWSAHKLRNRIAHENTNVSIKTARATLAAFRKALKDLGAI